MLREDVREFNQVVAGSYGIYKYRWEDAPLRYVTMAMFSQPGHVLFNLEDVKLRYNHGGYAAN